MIKAKAEILFVGSDRSLFEAFQERASYFTILPASNGYEAVSIGREMDSAIAVMKMDASGAANGKMIKEKLGNCELIFYSNWGNAPHFRQRLDELGFEAAYIIPTKFLLKYANEVLWSIVAKEPKEYDRGVLEAKVSLPLVDNALWESLADLLKFSKFIVWRELEDLVWHRIQPFDCEIYLTKRTTDEEIDILAIARRGWGVEPRCILQARRWSNTVVVEPIRQLLFFRAGHASWCFATTASFAGKNSEPTADYHWKLEVWDYSELKDWTLRQGWWGT